MSNKVGRNAPCPCGSGLKFKKCHGKSGVDKGNVFKNFKPQGFVIEDFTGSGKQVISLGSPGVHVSGSRHVFGDFKPLESNPEKYLQVINVDIPFLLPIEEKALNIKFQNQFFLMHHRIKKRGEEYFSTLDSNRLPNFSTLQFQGELFPIQGELYPDTNPEGELISPKSYDLIIDSIQKINSLFDESEKLPIDNDLGISYFVLYCLRENFPNAPAVAKITFPYTGQINLKSPGRSRNVIDENLLKDVLLQERKIRDYSKSKVVPKTVDKEFNEKVQILTHDFAFYCSQHPETLGKLKEEHLRDLFLILAKAVFEYAEGEPFHFDGKLDYKITNVFNKYEYITGEFKWWTGSKSFEAAFHQAIRKHATGQESCIYILMLNKNKDILKVYDKVLDLAKNQPEYTKTIPDNIVPDKSKQLFTKMIVNLRGIEIPLIIGIVDCYFQKQ